MKKQLLFTLAFLATIFVASAQSNTFTFTGTAAESLSFPFGSTAAVYTLSGTDFTQKGSFMDYTSEVASGSPISESFGIETSGGSVNATFKIVYRK